MSQVTSVYKMFAYNKAFNRDLDHWDTASFLNTASFFTGHWNFYPVFSGDLTKWDTSSVTTMYRMFNEFQNFNGNISSWDTSSVTSMGGMFYKAKSFNSKLNTWDVSAVKDMQSMFNCFETNPGVFDQPLDRWDTSQVTNMHRMFEKGIVGSNSITAQSIASWDMQLVTDISQMFYSEEPKHLDLSSWDLASITVCDKANYYNIGCHPSRLLELGCFDTCCPTSVANSNYSADYSLEGVLGGALTVECDYGYTFSTANGVTPVIHASCDPQTGIYDDLYTCLGSFI